MKVSVADVAMVGVVGLFGVSMIMLARTSSASDKLTIDQCASELASLPKTHLDIVQGVFNSTNRGVQLEKQVDALAQVLDHDGYPRAAACVRTYKAQILSDIESTPLE